MGFHKSTEVREALLSLVANRRECVYELSKGEKLPDELRFDAVITDLSSRLYSIYFGCKTGLDLLRYFNLANSTLATERGASTFIYCVDDRSHVDAAKGAERASRQQSKNAAPYDPSVVLKTEPATQTPLETYRFALDTALPDDYDRLLATPQLRRAWFVFLGTLLSCYAARPAENRTTSITVSGFRRCACGNSHCAHATQSSVVKTVFLFGSPVREMTLEQQTVIGLNRAALVASGDFSHLAPELACGAEIPTLQSSCKHHIDHHMQRVSDSIEIGESEGQCFYWVDQLVRVESCTSILLRINDADGWACGLMCVPRLYNQRAHEIQKSLWLDATSTFSNQRYFNIVALWRQLTTKMYLLGEVARPASAETVSASASASSTDVASATATTVGQPAPKEKKKKHGLQHPAELFLFIATLTSNDYCNSLSQLGPAKIFKKMKESFVKKVAENDPPFLKINKHTGDMIIREEMAYDFLIAAYADMPMVQKALKALKMPLALFGTSESLDKLGVYLSKEESSLVMPSADFIRATVRRACFSLYYYYNLYKKMKINSLYKMNDLSLYGYLPEGEFAPRVVVQRDLRPFVVVGSFARRELQKSASAVLVSSTSSLSSVTSVEDDTPLKRKSSGPSGGGDDDDGDVDVDVEDKNVRANAPKKHASLPATPTTSARALSSSDSRATDALALLRLAAETTGHKVPENGPDYSWINNRTGRAFETRQPTEGEYGSNFHLLARMRDLSLVQSR
jgi:hypothetical protein